MKMRSQMFGIFLLTIILTCYRNTASLSESSSGSTQSFFGTLKDLSFRAYGFIGHLGELLGANIEEDCVFKCPKGMKARPNIFHHKIVNGCGVPGLQIPKHIPPYQLEECCKDHDLCYITCGEEKEKCDKEFKKCLYSICSTFHKSFHNDAVLTGCKSVAKTLYLMVVGGGCKYYLDAQRDACVCEKSYKIYDNEF